MQVYIESITDNPDGSVTAVVNMDLDTSLVFARIGLLKTITDEVKDFERESIKDEINEE